MDDILALIGIILQDPAKKIQTELVRSLMSITLIVFISQFIRVINLNWVKV